MASTANTQINIPLAADLTAYVVARVESGAYGTPSDYVRDLILNDRDRQHARMQDQLEEALEEEPVLLSQEDWNSGDIMAIGAQRLAERR